MTSCNDFDYWAAVESSPETTIPFDMQTVAIPGGLYARCSVDRLEQLGEAYTYLYGEWIEQQSEYILNMSGVCFELYPQNWQEMSVFEIHVPVSKK